MSNIRYLEGQLDHHWAQMKDQYPAFSKPQIVPAATVRGAAPMYLRRNIDQDPNSFYMFIQGDPVKGDCSREAACRLFDDFFYNRMQMPSSYDVDAGGEYSRVQAIDKEVLPAKNDDQYKTFYQEQMEILRDMIRGEEADEKENGGDVVDMDIVGDVAIPRGVGPSARRDVGAAQERGLARPKQIWYGVDFHIPAGGNAIGMGGAGRVKGRGDAGRLDRGRAGYLDEDLRPENAGGFGDTLRDMADRLDKMPDDQFARPEYGDLVKSIKDLQRIVYGVQPLQENDLDDDDYPEPPAGLSPEEQEEWMDKEMERLERERVFSDDYVPDEDSGDDGDDGKNVVHNDQRYNGSVMDRAWSGKAVREDDETLDESFDDSTIHYWKYLSKD